jgi:prepilin-type processing-associated H-X9-DG protein
MPWQDDEKCFWRGPRLEEIRGEAYRFVLFLDAIESTSLYVCNFANAGSAYVPNTSFDPRHLGGTIYGFADGHAAYYKDPDGAYIRKEIRDSYP